MPSVLVCNRSDCIVINNITHTHTPQRNIFQTMSVAFLQEQQMSTGYLASKKLSVISGDEIMIINILQAV